MTCTFSVKLIVSVVTLLCLIHFSSVCNAKRMLRESKIGEENNYQGKGKENDNLFKEEKDDSASPSPATPNIGGFPFPFNFPPFSDGIPNIPFNFPFPDFGFPPASGGGLPGFGIPGTGDNNPFSFPIPGVPNVAVPPPAAVP
uniref:U1 small nuclear ribonucleoprotein C-like n=1 Tax=Nicotiana tabacum TaxID=4097 RepID=A0A1S4C1N5_TOBAC|nr:PREDICTED: U1 small nuclear ribonucleoprotein C-like [Nicotiana tabacum]